MKTPRWTYSEPNATRWKPAFDAIIAGQRAIAIPLPDNARTLTSLKVRVGDALKWLADQYTGKRDESFKHYSDLKRRVRFGVGESGLILKLRHPPSFQPAPDTSNVEQVRIEAATVQNMLKLIENANTPPESRKRLAAVAVKCLTDSTMANELVKNGCDLVRALLIARRELAGV